MPSRDRPPELLTDAEIREKTLEIGNLVEQVAPLFAGREPSIVSAVLADCVAIYLAGHVILDHPEETDELREDLLDHFVRLVRQLIVPNAKVLGS